MPASTPAAVRKKIAQGEPDRVYLIVGDDGAEMSALAGDFSSLVEDGLSAFNVERVYASDRSTTAASIVEAASLLPMVDMMASHRVVIVLRAEKLLKPKRRAKDEPAEDDLSNSAPADTDVLEAYIKSPEPQSVLVMVAADVDRSRRLYKAFQKHATIVECWGLKHEKDERVSVDELTRRGAQRVQQTVMRAGRQIDKDAAQLIAARAGSNLNQLHGDVEKLLLFSTGEQLITTAAVREVATPETSLDDWAVTNAIERRDTARALKELALALDAGGVPYKILGQLAWFVRERLGDPRRIRPALDALFRTDVDLKSSGGDARVLLERLVVELCGSAPGAAVTTRR